MTTIKHNRYNDAGQLIGTFEVPVEPSNETATDIYITDKFLRNSAKNAQPGTGSTSNYNGMPKDYWYRPDNGEPVRIKSMECKHCGSVYEVIFTRLDGKKITKYLPL